MKRSRSTRRPEKPRPRYHHGDLARALRQETLRLIGSRGIAAVTVREVGAGLGVSRSALYRHYPDKHALLAAVAAEGFVSLRRTLLAAWTAGTPDLDRFAALGAAYVGFAVTYPSYYRVMFGGTVTDETIGKGVDGESTDALGVLVDAIRTLQRMALVRPDDATEVAYYAWSVVHGIAMLALDDLLPNEMNSERLIAYANGRIRAGIARVELADPRR